MEQEQFELVDDGTLDTVIRATCCGKVYRFTYQPEFDDTDPDEPFTYEDFVGNCFDNLREEHECQQ